VQFRVDGLGREGLSVRSSTAALEALEIIAAGSVDIVLVDINMPGMNGLELCRRILDSRPDIVVIVISAFGSLETAVAAIRAGAYDFVTKPFEIEQLAVAVERARQHRELRDEVKRLRQAVADAQPFEDILGESPALRHMCSLVDGVANGESTVLITGESGTGKELVARALHQRGSRSKGPFVALNCAAMTDSLLESELFGHARGAFTDAKEARAGLLVKAKGGTFLLDEVGEMPLGMQAKLLRRWRPGWSGRWAAMWKFPLTPVSSRPPTGISKPTWKMGVFGATSTFASMSSASTSRPCEREAATSCFLPSISPRNWLGDWARP